jgi:hypothetical protein
VVEMAKVRPDGVFEAILGILQNLKPEAETTVNIAAGATYVVPKGIYIIIPGPNTAIEVTYDGTNWRPSAAGAGAMMVSDGASVRLNNGGAAAEDSYLIELG